jgi:hypothetical protein
MKILLKLFAFLLVIVSAHDLCFAYREPFFAEEFPGGYFLTKDGRTQTVDQFTNLTSFHTFIYRRQGIVAQIHIVLIKRLRDLGDNRIEVTKKNGEVFTVETWGFAKGDCMVFTYFKAEMTVYVNQLYYKFYNSSEGTLSQSRVSLCDIKEIVFD